jgi:hypothetical protein
MTISLVSEIFTHEELKDGTAEAWINTQDPQNISSVMQTQAGNATVTLTLVFGEGIGIGEAYNTAINSLNVVENAPLDQQVLDPNPVLNAVTTAQSSTAIYTLDKKSVTLGVSVSNLTSGATIKVEASNTGDTGDWGAIGTVDNVGNVEKERVFGTGDLTENGAYFFEIVNAQRVKYMRVTLENVIDGTYTAYLTGGAI